MIKRGFFNKYADVLIRALQGFEIAMIGIIGYSTYVWRFGNWQMADIHLAVLLFGILSSTVLFPQFSLYQPRRGQSIFAEIRLFSLAWASIFIGLIIIMFFMRQSHALSRVWLAVWFFSGWLSLASARLCLRFTLRRLRENGFNQRSVIIVGAGDLGEQVARQIQENHWLGLSVSAFFDDSPQFKEKQVAGVPVKGTLNNIQSFVEENPVNQIWIALPLRAEERIKFVLQALKDYHCPIHFIPDIFNFQVATHTISEIANIPVINLNTTPIIGGNRFLKAIEDRVLAAFFLLAISPLMGLIAIAIKLQSPGPVIFRQKRNGWNGEIVEIWKFRTMVVHQEAPGTFTQATQNDSRITRLGQFLRGTSLDELPQFINVLQGRMSLVGPRPHPIPLNDDFKDIVPSYMQRHLVKPGITGWAQINGWRGETNTVDKMKNRVECDLYYIQNWSLWLDFHILFVTLYKGFINSEIRGVFQRKEKKQGMPSPSAFGNGVAESLDKQGSKSTSMPSQEFYLLKGQLKQAISMGRVDRAETLLKKVGPQLPLGLKLYFEGTLHGNREESRQALKCYLKSLSELETIEDEEDRNYVYIRATRSIAITKCKLGEDFVGAIQLLEDLKSYPVLQNDKHLLLQVHITLTVVHYYTQNYETVINELQKFLDSSPSTEHVLLSQSHLFLALSHIHLEQEVQSELHFRQALYHFQHLAPEQLQNQHFLYGWMGWGKLTQELEKLAHDMVDRDLAEETMQTFKNGLTLYDILLENSSGPFQQTESVKQTIQKQLNPSLKDSGRPRLKLMS